MNTLILRVPLLTLLWQISPAYAADTPAKATKIDGLMLQYADCCLYTGTVLVSDHDKVIFKRGYGLANREWNIPNTPDVKFRLGSITKQFTSMLITQQVAKFCSGDFQFEPGTKFHYDNSGFFILGAILEHVTGKTYEALLKENILVPLGMKDSGYDHYSDVLPKRASGYEQALAGVVNAQYLDMALPYAAGSLYSTVEDLYKWDQALYTDKLVSNDFKQKLFTPNLEHYGYGWDIRLIPAGEPGGGQTMISHGGGINGFNTLEQRFIGDHTHCHLQQQSRGEHIALEQ